jgi:manganese transport protein
MINRNSDLRVLPADGWRRASTHASLPEVNASMPVPQGLGFWRKMLAFSGPGYLIAVGYMDPGNWATDLAGGARFNYQLLSVIMISNLMAVLLQSFALRLGIVTGRDLAQACRDHFHPKVSFVLWILCEVAIIACDLAEVIGSAIALNLLFGIPLIYGVLLTGFDVMILLLLQNRGFRWLEAVVITLVATVGVCFALEIIFAPGNRRHSARLRSFGANRDESADALHRRGILGATVMPHNLYLHSSITQTRKYERTPAGRREAIKFSTIDSTFALMFALLSTRRF